MRIISWNVNGIRAAYRKGLVHFIEKQNPDIFCVQETKAHLKQIPEELREPHCLFSHWSSAQQKGYSGTATFLAEQSEDVSFGIGVSSMDGEGRFVITKHPQFTLFNVYFPNGSRSPERHYFKMEFLDRLLVELHRRIKAGEELIVLGDYNIAPNEIDIYDPVRHKKTSGFLPEERAWFQNFLQLGFVDTFRALHPQESERYTWWNQMERARLSNRGWRIDMICVTEGLFEVLNGAEIMEDITGSDHCPIAIDLDL